MKVKSETTRVRGRRDGGGRRTLRVMLMVKRSNARSSSSSLASMGGRRSSMLPGILGFFFSLRRSPTPGRGGSSVGPCSNGRSSTSTSETSLSSSVRIAPPMADEGRLPPWMEAEERRTVLPRSAATLRRSVPLDSADASPPRERDLLPDLVLPPGRKGSTFGGGLLSSTCSTRATSVFSRRFSRRRRMDLRMRGLDGTHSCAVSTTACRAWEELDEEGEGPEAGTPEEDEREV